MIATMCSALIQGYAATRNSLTGCSRGVRPCLGAENQLPYQISQGGDEPGIGADGRHAAVGRDAALLCDMAVFAVEFDQRLRVLRDKRDRHDDNADPVAAGPPQFLLDRRPNP